MANIMLNAICNLRCPYCFAEDRICNSVTKDITIPDFISALEFVTRTDSRVGIIGGEPTIHPEFRQIMKLATNDRRVRDVTLFTNGIMVDKFYDVIINPKVGILVNLNHPDTVGRERYDRIMRNLGHLKSYMKGRVNLGINLYRPDQDFQYIVDALLMMEAHNLRLSVVVPNSTDKRNVNPLQYFREMKPVTMSLFKELAKYEIVPNSDCNYIPTCIYTDEELQWIIDTFYPLRSKYGVFCNLADDMTCTGGVMDINPDLSVSRCFGMSEELRIPVDEYDDLDEVRGVFHNEVESFAYQISLNEECKTCKKRCTQKCSGGCYAFKADKIRAIKQSIRDMGV